MQNSCEGMGNSKTSIQCSTEPQAPMLHEVQEILSSLQIPKSQEDEIKKLLRSIESKYAMCRLMKTVDVIPTSKNVIIKELTEKYSLRKECHESQNKETTVLFGLSNLDIRSDILDEMLSPDLQQSFMLGSGIIPRGEAFCLHELKTKMNICKLFLELQNEMNLNKVVINVYKECIIKCAENVVNMQKALLKSMCSQTASCELIKWKAKLLKYEILKSYFVDHEKIVDATFYINDKMNEEIKELGDKENTLRKKLEQYKQIEGPAFQKLCIDYCKVQKSIEQKKWVLKNLQK